MMSLVFLGLGFVASVSGAELLVRGASRLAATLGVSALVIGLTVVAFGTSAPELAVSIRSALAGQADVALGNVVGSNNFNVLLILGLAALITPLAVDQKLVRFEIPLMILVSLLVWLLARDGVVDRREGAALFAGLIGYLLWCLKSARSETQAIQREYAEELQSMTGDPASIANGAPRHSTSQLWNVGLVLGGLALLVLGADWLVEGATQLARRWGVSELVIGLTVVAGGTSLPELTTSVVAAMRGERDIAVGNVVGSNLFNLLGVLGLTAAIAPNGVAVADQALQFDIPVMIVVGIACLPIFFTGHRIARWEGALFLGYYTAYITALILIATGSEAWPLFRLLMLSFMLPLTTITLLVVVARSLRWSRG